MFACCSFAEVESYATQSLSGTIYRVKLRVAGGLWQVIFRSKLICYLVEEL
jgi:hypothetical protein